MTMSLRSTQRVLFAPIEMLDSWTHQQDPEMIARPGPRYSLLESLPSKTCSGVIGSAQAGHLTEKPLDAQLQVPYNRWTAVIPTAPPDIPDAHCSHRHALCLAPSVVNTFFFTVLIYYFIWTFQGVAVWFRSESVWIRHRENIEGFLWLVITYVTAVGQPMRDFLLLPLRGCTVGCGNLPRTGKHRSSQTPKLQGWRHK